MKLAAVTRGQRQAAEQKPAAESPAADFSPVLPYSVLPQNPSNAAEQQSLSNFHLQVQQGYEQDKGWYDMVSASDWAKCTQRSGLWWYKDALVIPDSQSFRKQCLRELHDCPYSGHLGVTKTQKAIDRLYW